jgi:hypothetical protein
MFFKSLHSPLVGTVGVLAALGLLAIPLRHLTSATRAQPIQVDPARPAAAPATPAVLRLKLLTPARTMRVDTEDGVTLLDLTDVPAGESEHDARLPLHDGNLDLSLEVDFGDDALDTAVFLTVMPDAYEEQTRYVIGRGKLDEPLRYDWHHH